MRAGLWAAAAAACLFACFAQEQPAPPKGPAQPLPFSHKLHAGAMKQQCKMCHPSPDPGETMTIAQPSTCMQCHSAIKTESPAIQTLAEAAKAGRPIAWAPVYAIPSFVYFSHRAHLEKGNTCQECHGPVAERERLHREGDITMGGCMECHRQKKVSIHCTFCHARQ